MQLAFAVSATYSGGATGVYVDGFDFRPVHCPRDADSATSTGLATGPTPAQTQTPVDFMISGRIDNFRGTDGAYPGRRYAGIAQRSDGRRERLGCRAGGIRLSARPRTEPLPQPLPRARRTACRGPECGTVRCSGRPWMRMTIHYRPERRGRAVLGRDRGPPYYC